MKFPLNLNCDGKSFVKWAFLQGRLQNLSALQSRHKGPVIRRLGVYLMLTWTSCWTKSRFFCMCIEANLNRFKILYYWVDGNPVRLPTIPRFRIRSIWVKRRNALEKFTSGLSRDRPGRNCQMRTHQSSADYLCSVRWQGLKSRHFSCKMTSQ